MINDYLELALAEFCQRNKLPAMQFNENGLCHLLLGDRIPITICKTAWRQQITLILQVQAQVPSVITQSWVEKFFSTTLNPVFNEEPTLGWIDSIGLVAYVNLDQAKNEQIYLEEGLSRLVSWMEGWERNTC
ncbi:CesT family type III secretion system chaperone [Chromobacterium sp. IIBBL 290-4]|uniref:CesT family type III secretion system chaperone n=1 Tax=Chromobacterium sp. IIBBL 290-4 TaxID=2953890 RepID=UPI0020B8694B|nr:CesT family type III secretion system chaperone [Chromobacterium sp. IIBBL 290-4]UTH74110.1 type III secretion system chaperone [Chromobacterium sp. IIBBL 290-4]